MSDNQFPLVNALGRAEELAAWLDQCEYEDEISATMGGEIAALLRAQSAELLALRAALKQAGEEIEGWRKECDDDRSRGGAMLAYEDNYFPKYITTALNSPTQKSPAK